MRHVIFSSREREVFIRDTAKLRELANDYNDAPREIVIACADEIDRLTRLCKMRARTILDLSNQQERKGKLSDWEGEKGAKSRSAK